MLAIVLKALRSVGRRRLLPNPEDEAYWNDPANRHWARHTSVYEDKGC